jgi:DNA-binding response OmpR family regulator
MIAGENGLSVLIVEDEELIADMLVEVLQDEGFRVVGPAARVGDALALVERDPPDVAVLDVSLGQERSFPIARMLAERGIPFVFMTGYSDGGMPPEFRDRPVMTKPVKLQLLTDRVRSLCIAQPDAQP